MLSQSMLSSHVFPSLVKVSVNQKAIVPTMAEPPPIDSALRSLTTADPEASLNTPIGYDYEFETPPDERYRCAICTMILREPVQTTCGHLYCRACLQQWWSRGPNKRCPLDNETLKENTVFLDNFSKREIDNLRAFCPNRKHGCDVIEIVKRMQSHLNDCPLALVPCPNKCCNLFHRRTLYEHVQHFCENREVECSDCNFKFLAIDFENHKGECQKAKVPCQYCQQHLTREQVSDHETTTCPKKEIPCTFNQLGCGVQVAREDLMKHIEDNLVHHLNLLCHAVTSLFQLLNVPPLHPSNLLPGSAGSMTRADMTHVLTTVMAALNISPDLHGADARSLQGGGGPSGYFTPPSSLTPALQLDTSTQPSSSLHLTATTTTTTTTSSTQYVAPPSTSAPAPTTLLTEAREAEMMSYRSDYSKPDGAEVGPGYSPQSGKWGEAGKSLASSLAYSVAGSPSWQTEQKLVIHEQELARLRAKVDNVEMINKQKMKQYEQQISEMEGRLCQGLMYWKINNYSKYQHEAERGDSSALHSQPFYSSPTGGYKLCVRANLNGVDSARGSHLSLFIHFMQGEYDDVLDWPFSGHITIAVMDQSDLSHVHHHIEETLVAKPTLAAFQRPTTPRNHKGFGYMEFLPLSALKNSSYVKNDTLIVKVHVFPQGNGGVGRLVGTR